MLRHAENWIWIKHEITWKIKWWHSLKTNVTNVCAELTNEWSSYNVRQYDSSQPEMKVIVVFKSTNLWTVSSNCLLTSLLWVVAHPGKYQQQLFACPVFSLGLWNTHTHTHTHTHTYTHASTHKSTAHQESTSKEWSGGILSGRSQLRCTRVVTDTAWLQEVALSYSLKNLWPQSQNYLSSRAHQHEKKTEQPSLAYPLLEGYLLANCILGCLAKSHESCNAKPCTQAPELNTARHMDTNF